MRLCSDFMDMLRRLISCRIIIIIIIIIIKQPRINNDRLHIKFLCKYSACNNDICSVFVNNALDELSQLPGS